MMISHRLADDYVMADLFNFGYDLLQSFCSVCKTFLFADFINENKVFSFQKKKKKALVLAVNRIRPTLIRFYIWYMIIIAGKTLAQ